VSLKVTLSYGTKESSGFYLNTGQEEK